MANKFNLSAICKRAWWAARNIARDTGCTIRAALSEGFKSAWRLAKFDAAPKAIVLPRETFATRSQIAYIESLLGRGKSAPAGLTKAAASTLIDRLKATKGNGLRSEDPSFDYGWY